MKECVCGHVIDIGTFPGQRTGTAGGEDWWFHTETGRRSHTRDRSSPFFHETPFAQPKEN